jgi:amino acid permease
MAKKPKPPPLTAIGAVISFALYLLAFPFCIRVAIANAQANDFTIASIFIFLSIIIVSFEFHHIDMYSAQRGEEFNLAAILVFFAVSMLLINGAVEG